MGRNARAIVSMLPLDAFCCGLLRLVTVAPIPNHICGMDKDIGRCLKAFVATLHGPLGQIPFERAVMRHLPLFLDLRRHGLTWMSIAGLLRARDVRRADGQLISADQLRSVVSRQSRRSHS
jgi:hypothetical protein